MALERFIPHNHFDGQAIAGVMIKTRNLVEGIILAAIPFGLTFYFGKPLRFADKLTIACIIAMPLFMLSVQGINGDSLTVFIKSWIRYLKRKRILFYNPRVKTEATPLIFEKQTSQQVLPRERILELVNKIKIQQKAKQQAKQKRSLLTYTDDGPVFFEDDIGVLAMPDEYKTAKEIKAEKKKAKKRRKQEMKKNKRSENERKGPNSNDKRRKER